MSGLAIGSRFLTQTRFYSYYSSFKILKSFYSFSSSKSEYLLIAISRDLIIYKLQRLNFITNFNIIIQIKSIFWPHSADPLPLWSLILTNSTNIADLLYDLIRFPLFLSCIHTKRFAIFPYSSPEIFKEITWILLLLLIFWALNL